MRAGCTKVRVLRAGVHVYQSPLGRCAAFHHAVRSRRLAGGGIFVILGQFWPVAIERLFVTNTGSRKCVFLECGLF